MSDCLHPISKIIENNDIDMMISCLPTEIMPNFQKCDCNNCRDINVFVRKIMSLLSDQNLLFTLFLFALNKYNRAPMSVGYWKFKQYYKTELQPFITNESFVIEKILLSTDDAIVLWKYPAINAFVSDIHVLESLSEYNMKNVTCIIKFIFEYETNCTSSKMKAWLNFYKRFLINNDEQVSLLFSNICIQFMYNEYSGKPHNDIGILLQKYPFNLCVIRHIYRILGYLPNQLPIFNALWIKVQYIYLLDFEVKDLIMYIINLIM